MGHVTVAALILAQLGGAWVLVLSVLQYRVTPSKRLFYFVLFALSTLILIASETAVAYCEANRIHGASTFLCGLRWTYTAGAVLHFYSVGRLAYVVVARDLAKGGGKLHLLATAAFALASTSLILSSYSLDLVPLALGVSHCWAAAVLWGYRSRIQNQRLRSFVDQVVLLVLLFPPLIVVTFYSGLLLRLPSSVRLLQLLYALVMEILVGIHVARAYFSPNSPIEQSSLVPSASTALSPREREIARLVGKGYTNPEIARLLTISPKTVSNHLYHMYKKLGVVNRVELLAELYTHIDPTEPTSPTSSASDSTTE
jgi:DNA-binding CsgD family transcriptional regulator